MIARLVTFVVSVSLLLMSTVSAFAETTEGEPCPYEITATDSHEPGDAETTPSPVEEDSSEQEDDDDNTKLYSSVRTYSTYTYHRNKIALHSPKFSSYFPEIVSPPPQF